LLLCDLDAALYVTDRVQILDKLTTIDRPERPLELCDFFGNGIEHASLLLDARQARFWIGVSRVAEESFENNARIVLSGERRVRALPRDRVGVSAGETNVACPSGLAVFNRKLERCELRVLARFPGQDLIH